MRFRMTLLLISIIALSMLVSTAQEADSGYTVVEVIDLEQLAGPVGTAVFMNPDGSQYAHFADRAICLYTLPDNEEEACYDVPEPARPATETVRWSPDSQYIAFVDQEALRNFRDSDIQILDIAAGEIRNLTDDEYDGLFALQFDDEEATFGVDYALAWSDDNQLAVLRYPYVDGENEDSITHIVIVDPITGENTVLVEHDFDRPFLYFSIAWSGNTIAVGEDTLSPDYGIQSIDLYDSETGDLLEEIPLSEVMYSVFSVAFSPDEDYIMAYNPLYRRRSLPHENTETELDGMNIISMDDGSESNLDSEHYVLQAGFAPEGTAIAYVVQNLLNPEESGLYIAPAIGEEAELVLQMNLPDGTTPLSYTQLMWASNNTIMIRDNETWNAMLVILEEN